TYLPASMLLTLLAMTVLTCGGGGGGGGGGRGDLTGLSINGPSSVSEYGTGTYTATASWSDNSTSTVTPTWSVNPQVAEISTGGVLSCQGGIDSDQTVSITATFSSGGITETDTMDVTITNITTSSFTPQMVSGNAFFEENINPGGSSDSSLSLFNADLSFERYSLGGYNTGTWSIDASGNLIVNISGQETVTVMLVSDSPTEMQVLIDDGTGTPFAAALEKTVPVDPAKLPGTYVQSPENYTWAFESNGTGSTSGFGGFSLTWSVDSKGILKMPASNGFSAWFYARASSQSTASAYTVLKVAFPEFLPGGDFYKYYGGKVLTRQ
ncbi:MAG: hypothetical protein ACM3OG_09975, partial [Actinomycetota bacterium]